MSQAGDDTADFLVAKLARNWGGRRHAIIFGIGDYAVGQDEACLRLVLQNRFRQPASLRLKKVLDWNRLPVVQGSRCFVRSTQGPDRITQPYTAFPCFR